MASIVVNGNTYTDTGSASGRDLRGTDGYGHTRWLLPMLGDAVADFKAKQDVCEQAVADVLGWRNSASGFATAASDSASAAAASAGAAASSASSAATAKTAAETAAETAAQKAAQASSITGLPLPSQPNKFMRANAAGTAYVLGDADPPKIAARSLSATGSILTNDMAGLIALAPPIAGMTLNLPAASTCPDGWWCYLSMSSTGGLATVDPAGSELINGASTIVLQPGEVRLLRSTAAGWQAVLIGAPDQTFRAEGQYMAPSDENATTAANVWLRRGINTVNANSLGASLSGSVVTLPPGTYDIDVTIPMQPSQAGMILGRVVVNGTETVLAVIEPVYWAGNGQMGRIVRGAARVVLSAQTGIVVQQKFPYPTGASNDLQAQGYSINGGQISILARFTARRVYAA